MPDFQPTAYLRPLPPDMLAPAADPDADVGIGTFAQRTLADLDAYMRHRLRDPHPRDGQHAETFTYDLGRYLCNIRSDWILELRPQPQHVPTSLSPGSVPKCLHRAALLTHGIVHAALGHTADALRFLRHAERGDDETPVDAVWALRAAILHDLLADRPELAGTAAACRSDGDSGTNRAEAAAARLVDAELFAYRLSGRDAALRRHEMAGHVRRDASVPERHVAASAARAEARYRASLGDPAGAQRPLRRVARHVTDADFGFHAVTAARLAPRSSRDHPPACRTLEGIIDTRVTPAVPEALAALAERDPEALDTVVDTAAKLLKTERHPEFHAATAGLLLRIAADLHAQTENRLFLSAAEKKILAGYHDLIDRATRPALDHFPLAGPSHPADPETGDDARLDVLRADLLVIRGRSVPETKPRQAVALFGQAARAATESTHLRCRRSRARALSLLAGRTEVSGSRKAVRDMRMSGFPGDPDPEVRFHAACGQTAYARAALRHGKLRAATAAANAAAAVLEGIQPTVDTRAARLDAAVLQAQCVLRRTAPGARDPLILAALEHACALAPPDGSRLRDLQALGISIRASCHYSAEEIDRILPDRATVAPRLTAQSFASNPIRDASPAQ